MNGQTGWKRSGEGGTAHRSGCGGSRGGLTRDRRRPDTDSEVSETDDTQREREGGMEKQRDTETQMISAEAETETATESCTLMAE